MKRSAENATNLGANDICLMNAIIELKMFLRYACYDVYDVSISLVTLSYVYVHDFCMGSMDQNLRS